MRQKMSVIAGTDLNNDNDDILIDKKTFEKLKDMDLEEMEYEVSSSDEEVLNEKQEEQNLLKRKQYAS